MLPADRIQVRFAGSEALPVWLGAEDYGWIRALIDDFARLEGRPYREASAFLQEPSRAAAPGGKRRMAIWTLLSQSARERPPFDVSALRDAVAIEAQIARDAGRFDRSEALAGGARRLGLAAPEADGHLFADLPGERRLRPPRPLPDPAALASRTNLALAQGLLRLASEVAIEVYGNARPVVRQVRLRRLLCTIRGAVPRGVRLEISGPFSLFRHTTMYGRALASILPLLPWCDRFELTARCMVRGRSAIVRFRPGDPIPAGAQPRAYDSRLEERFARDFARAHLDWDLVREPEPLQAGEVLIFPDFALVHRRDASRRFLLEIIGFWTPEYLRDKLHRLRAMPRTPLLLCIDRALNCSAGDLPGHARVVWFNRRINPNSVLAAIEPAEEEPAPRAERLRLGDLFLDWAGRRAPSDPVHGRLEALAAGDPVRLRRDGPWIVLESEGGPVAVLSRPGRARWEDRLDRILSARLVETVERQAARSAPAWRAGLRCERWLVPIVEVFLAPAPGAGHGETAENEEK